MKSVLLTLALAASCGSALAQDQTVYRDGEERALPQATGTYSAPPTQLEQQAWTTRQRCTYEANLLQQAAWGRDRGVRQHDAEASVSGVVAKSPRYSAEFAHTFAGRIDWIYAHPSVDPDMVQIGYLKECDPQHYAAY